MGVLGAVARTAQAYPALFLPLVLLSIASALWAYRNRRWSLMAASVVMGGASALFFTGGFQAEALSRASNEAGASILPGSGTTAAGPGRPSSGGGGPPRPGAARIPGDYGNFYSATRLHPRFPEDLPLPPVFKIEHSSGGLRTGSVTERFRFRGDGKSAVHDLKELAEKGGWQVEVLAPHRLVLRKEGREVDAWFSYPAHSVVLDINDQR
jgi:hypothetical protein